MKKINLQLWSIKEDTAADFEGTLEKVAKIGYSGVEFAGFGNISAQRMKTILSNNGLEGISAHVGVDQLNNELDNLLEYLNTIGSKFIVCPFAHIRSIESALTYAESFNRIGEKCKATGITFGYHNHEHEFTLDNGKYPMNVLFENVEPGKVIMEPDLYWVAYAGIDPMEYIVANKDICPIIHLKQIENMETKANVDAQDGIIDFNKVMSICNTAVFVYEQEEFKGTPMDSVTRSARYFNTNS